jgi:site-specific DNA recombinase
MIGRHPRFAELENPLYNKVISTKMANSSNNSNIPMRAALYVRVSSEDQAREGYSLVAQQEKLEEYGKKNGYLLNRENIYIDDGYSGKTENRPALRRLSENAQKHNFDVVLVYRLDRFFRNVRLLLESVEMLGQHGVGLKSITEPFDTSTPIGRYVLVNLGAIAELERAIIMERKELGTLKAAQDGKWMGGTPPYGYRIKRETKKLELVKKDAKVVKMLYNWLVNEKMTLYKIQQRINSMSIPTKHDLLSKAKPTGSRCWWRTATLARMFQNEIYAGTFWFRKYKHPTNSRTVENLRPEEEWVSIPVPPVVSKTQFELARKQIEENRKLSPRRTERTYLFSKKLYCGLCGGLMVAQYQPPGKSRRTEVKFYTCHKRSKQHTPVLCTQKSIVETRIEVPLWEALKKLLMNPEAMLGEIETLQKKDDHRPALLAKQEQIEKQLKGLESKRERILDLYMEGAIEKAVFLERSRKLEQDKDGIVKKNIELSQRLAGEEERAFKATSIRELYKRIGKNLDEADYETKRYVISLLVHRITLNAEGMSVECHIPHQFLDGEKGFRVALRRNGGVDCDTKNIILFFLKPLPLKSLSQICRERNLKYGLKRNLFYPNGRLKERLGEKAKGNYSLRWHTRKFEDPMVLGRFLEVRNIILSYSCYREEFRKKYIVFVDRYLYNRFILLPNRRHFWLAVKGANLHEDELHSYSDSISTFFKVSSDVRMERLKGIILKHIEKRTGQHKSLQTASHVA